MSKLIIKKSKKLRYSGRNKTWGPKLKKGAGVGCGEQASSSEEEA